MIRIRGLTVLIGLVFAVVLLIGGRNLGMGVNTKPLPLLGLLAITLGLGTWCAISWFARPFPWFRSFLVVSYIGLLVLVLQAFLGAYDESGGLSGPLDELSKSQLRAAMLFNIAFGSLSLLSVFGLRFCTRDRSKKDTGTSPA